MPHENCKPKLNLITQIPNLLHLQGILLLFIASPVSQLPKLEAQESPSFTSDFLYALCCFQEPSLWFSLSDASLCLFLHSLPSIQMEAFIIIRHICCNCLTIAPQPPSLLLSVYPLHCIVKTLSNI